MELFIGIKIWGGGRQRCKFTRSILPSCGVWMVLVQKDEFRDSLIFCFSFAFPSLFSPAPFLFFSFSFGALIKEKPYIQRNDGFKRRLPSPLCPILHHHCLSWCSKQWLQYQFTEYPWWLCQTMSWRWSWRGHLLSQLKPASVYSHGFLDLVWHDT